MRVVLPLVFSLMSFATCDHSAKKRVREEVRAAQPAPLPQPTPLPPPSPTPAPTALPTPDPTPTTVAANPLSPVSPDCRVVPGFKGDEPVYLPKTKVVLTRLTAPCTTTDGQAGHLPTASWMAMGFPCTGGEGRIDWKGTNYNAPKMVSFLLNTNCPMAPTDQAKLKTMVSEEVGLAPTSSLVALNPFAVQYWEVVELPEADASFNVELRSGKSLTTGWTAFIKQKPLRVFLVGRENAWVPGNHMYAVEGEIHWASKNRFTFHVLTARILKDDELARVKARCEALTPERECGKVF